jgi:hypothetical protein
MTANLKFYKIKLLEKFLTDTAAERERLLDELKVNATDPIIVLRRFRMLKHLSMYETQIIEKIQNFDTDNVEDIQQACIDINAILHRSA